MAERTTGQGLVTTAQGVLPADIVNGCSGGVTWFYNRFLGRDIGCRYCCDEHDLAYDEGGGIKDRWLADWRFCACIIDSGRPVRAVLFWLAVLLFGWLYWNGGGK